MCYSLKDGPSQWCLPLLCRAWRMHEMQRNPQGKGEHLRTMHSPDLRGLWTTIEGGKEGAKQGIYVPHVYWGWSCTFLR